MEVNRRLNIVDEVTDADSGVSVFVHSMPIRREVYDTHYLVLTKTISRMYEESITPIMGARIALRLLREVASNIGDDKRQQVDSLLLPEIWRLTNVLVPDKEQGGWQTLPFEKAIKDGLIDTDDADLVRNHLVFFTAASWVHTRKELSTLIYPMLSSAAFGAQVTPLSSTEFSSSLLTSTQAANTGETATASSTISSTGPV